MRGVCGGQIGGLPAAGGENPRTLPAAGAAGGLISRRLGLFNFWGSVILGFLSECQLSAKKSRVNKPLQIVVVLSFLELGRVRFRTLVKLRPAKKGLKKSQTFDQKSFQL